MSHTEHTRLLMQDEDDRYDQYADELRVRDEEIGKLANDMIQVNDIFRDLSVIVHTQGDALDNIESNMQMAQHNTNSGLKQLSEAKKHQKRSRKFMCCILALVIVIAIILAIVISQLRK